MFPYAEKHTESESDIQKNDLLYKIHQTCQNAFEFLENSGKFQKIQLLFYYIFKFNNSYFVLFVKFVILGFCCIFILHV